MSNNQPPPPGTQPPPPALQLPRERPQVHQSNQRNVGYWWRKVRPDWMMAFYDWFRTKSFVVQILLLMMGVVVVSPLIWLGLEAYDWLFPWQAD